MQEVVFMVDWHNEMETKSAMHIVSRFEGVHSVYIDKTGKKMTATGNADAVKIVNKLRRRFPAQLVSVGPVKQREVVLEMRWQDEEDMKKAVDTIFGSAEVDTVVINMKDQKLRVTGSIYAGRLVGKLREKRFNVEWHN